MKTLATLERLTFRAQAVNHLPQVKRGFNAVRFPFENFPAIFLFLFFPSFAVHILRHFFGVFEHNTALSGHKAGSHIANRAPAIKQCRVDLTGDGVLELALVVLADGGRFGEAEREMRCVERGVAVRSDTTDSSCGVAGLAEAGVLTLADRGVVVAFTGEGVLEFRVVRCGVGIFGLAVFRKALAGDLEGRGLGVVVCFSLAVGG
ncbi:hypothetical protein HG531_002083 [Fusarium graminearum]|nr:hypothetical protein HG531_002083 [Fusarium graminearum]